MKKSLIKEIENIIKRLNLNCSVNEFKDKVDWTRISSNQTLSEDFIREFEDKVNWYYISSSLVLSEEFIREFRDEVYWGYIFEYQKLSENFIREFKNYGYWYHISAYQNLSENFIREFKDYVNWHHISQYQNLSENFIKEFKDYIDIEAYNISHKEKSYKQKLLEVKKYAKKHNLKLTRYYLYAFREHDIWGRGAFNKTISYKKNKYYRDWHCNMNKANENSFGLGIWPQGNTKVKVKIEDWGCEVNRNDGKARVWGFQII